MSDKILHALFAGFPIAQTVRTSIVIPVRDEAENIVETLESFTRQIDLTGKPLNFERFEILILANNCTDDSARIVREFGRENSQLNLFAAEIELSGDDANIGFVRRVLMNAAHCEIAEKRRRFDDDRRRYDLSLTIGLRRICLRLKTARMPSADAF